jgi:hypothetical protein
VKIVIVQSRIRQIAETAIFAHVAYPPNKISKSALEMQAFHI